jgi:aminoglycoside phosphotransferase (APT) family kinase protein
MADLSGIRGQSLPALAAAWVESVLGAHARVLEAELLAGATSSTLYRLQVQQKGAVFPLVLRLFTNTEWLAEEPDIPRHEADALHLAQKSGLPVPELLAFDDSGRAGDAPVLLMTCLPGAVNLTPKDMDGWLSAMAEALLPIHATPADEFPYTYFPYYELSHLRLPIWAAQPRLWEQAYEVLQGGPPAHIPVFIHRDYHPVNVLWEGEQISGIVDWANACLGAPNHDVAHCRTNLVSMYGVETADRFLHHCREVFGPVFEHHPYWDINAEANMEPDEPLEPYGPWLEFGLTGLEPEVLIARKEAYLTSLLRQL